MGERRLKHSQTWTSRGRIEALQRAQVAKAARARELFAQSISDGAASRESQGDNPVPVTGLPRPALSGLNYRRTLATECLLSVGDGLALLDMLRRVAHDRRDRIVLAWPCRPDNGFVAAALHLLEGRVRGHHAWQAIGVWPWRSGITRASHSILVEPDGLVQCARAAIRERAEGATWTKAPFGTEAHEMVHLRLDDLRKEVTTAGAVTVRKPTLLELTSVFPPIPGWGEPYTADADQVLQRVRRYTRIKDIKGTCSRHVRSLGDPRLAPLAIFGLPAGDAGSLKRCLAFERFKVNRLDAIVVDLTRTSLNDIGECWTEAFERFLLTLESLGESRPGLVVLTENVFVMRKAEATVRKAVQAVRPCRPPMEVKGLLLRSPGFLERSAQQVMPLEPIEFRVDLKDGRLLALRDEVLRSARALEENEDRKAAAALRAGLSFVRSMANLPVGISDARTVAELMYATDDDADRAVRRKFFVADALQPLVEHARASRSGEILEAFRRKFMRTVEAWQTATPVSAKLAAMGEQDRDATQNVLLALPDRYVANIYNLSDAAQSCSWHVAEPKTILDVAWAHRCERWVVVRPTSDTLRTILTADPGPKMVDLLGDAAGSALLEMELRPLASLAAFTPVRDRAATLLKAIGRSTSNLEIDQEEATARTASFGELLDFTQSEGGYSGPRVRLQTEQGYTLLYRPASEVLHHTPDDLRAFEKIEARGIQVGDAVLVLSKPLMELLRRELARAPTTVETLRQYHAAVAAKRAALPGLRLSDKARHVVKCIQAKQPSFESNEWHNVARWLDVDGSTLDDPAAQPQAPRTRQRFFWFLDALGFMDMPGGTCLAKVWWDHGIRLTRSYRLSEGLQFNQRATAFVVDPESFAARAGGRDVRSLQQAIMENVDVVKRTEVLHVNGRD